MRCPACSAFGSLGLLRRYRKGGAHYSLYFCRDCCAEICFRGQQVMGIFTIDEEGEATPRVRRA